MATKIENIEAALFLTHLLEYEARGRELPQTMASSVYMREQRIKVIGALWQRLEEDGLPFSVVTLSLSECEVTDAKLLQFDPRRSNERLRAALNRAGAIDARGWGCFFLHCEREPTTETFRFHYHGVVSGDMVAVIDNLRKDPAFKVEERQVGGQAKSYSPIRMSRAPIENVPRALSYLLKSYWPQSWEGEIDGRAKRQKRHVRIQGPAHTRALLWLACHEIEQITLLMGLRVGRAGLIATKLPVHEMKGKMA